MIGDRVASLYGAQGASRCPGEDDCTRWQTSEEPKSDACATCPKVDTKPIRISPLTANDSAEIEELVKRIEDLAAQQGAGFTISADEVSPLEFELMKYWHSAVAVCERGHQARIAAIIEAMMTR